MKRHPRRQKEPGAVLHLWNYRQAEQALPYIRAVVASLREHWLAWNSSLRRAQRALPKTGRPDRHSLVSHDEAKKEAARGEQRFHDALAELQNLHVFLQDPNQGLALIPFAHGDELAWFVFDLFDAEGLAGWRFHRDSLTTRRPLSDTVRRGKKTPFSS